MEVFIAPQTVVDLSSEKGSVRAICRHSRPAPSGYVIGLEFLENRENSALPWTVLPAAW
jgi:hypothetical protein